MLYEYAVEPEALGSDFKTFSTITALIGVERGRFITQLPSEWRQWVLEAAEKADLGEIKIKSIQERLMNARPPIPIDAGRRWNPKISGWLENAVALHAQNPFRAILANCDSDADGVINIGELIDTDPLIEAPVSWEVPRTSDDISDALLHMVRLSRRIHIIDPFFDFRNYKDDFKGPLSSLLSKLYGHGYREMEFNIHYRNADNRFGFNYLEEKKEILLKNILPKGFKMIVHEWNERKGGSDFHDRHLITDIGGLTLGAGFGATDENQMLNISRVSADLADKIEGRFDRHTGDFDPHSPALCIDSDLNFTYI